MGAESEPSVSSERLPSSSEVLIKIVGGSMTALCAEPAIRSFKSKAGVDARITVCGQGCDILRNHSDIDNVVFSVEGVEDNFDVVLELSDIGCDESAEDVLERFALQLGVEVEDETPRVSLDSFDHVRCLKFGVSKIKHPRVAICTGFESGRSAWGEGKWNKLCSILEETLDSQIIQLGKSGNKYLGYGVDLIGKTSEREAVGLLGRVDLLVSCDDKYAMLARAIGTPCVLVSECKEAVAAEDAGSVILESDESCEVSVVCVVDNIIELCGNSGS